MGQRNIDRFTIQERYREAKTVGLMVANRWKAISTCQTCGLQMAVDLRLIILVSGPNVTLWNRWARCRRLYCGGDVYFSAEAPGRGGFAPMMMPEALPVRLPRR